MMRVVGQAAWVVGFAGCLGLAVGCSKSSGDGQGDAGQEDTGVSADDDASFDGAFDGDLTVEASTMAPMMPTQGCFKVTGTGSSQKCAFTASSAADCSAFPGTTKGTCPAANLNGCCTTEGASEAGAAATLSSTCYYGKGGSAAAACEDLAYESGGLEAWGSDLP